MRILNKNEMIIIEGGRASRETCDFLAAAAITSAVVGFFGGAVIFSSVYLGACSE